MTTLAFASLPDRDSNPPRETICIASPPWLFSINSGPGWPRYISIDGALDPQAAQDTRQLRVIQELAQYAGCQVEKLWKSDDFQELVGDSGDLSVALVASMLPRLD